MALVWHALVDSGHGPRTQTDRQAGHYSYDTLTQQYKTILLFTNILLFVINYSSVNNFKILQIIILDQEILGLAFRSCGIMSWRLEKGLFS